MERENNMSTLLIFVLGVLVGASSVSKIDSFFAVESRRQIKAICNKFNCNKNEFTYYIEDNDGYYIVSLDDREFRIKFSMNRPCQIVYCQEVECVRTSDIY